MPVANHRTAPEVPVPAPSGGDAQKLELSHLTQIFQPSPKKPALVALEDVSLEVDGGQFISIVGPTGCGKSTMLSAISGLRAPSKGEVRVGEQKVAGVRRDVGFVFQQDALLPWRTALQNVELALRFRGVDRKQSRERARSWLARVGLGAFENAYPTSSPGACASGPPSPPPSSMTRPSC